MKEIIESIEEVNGLRAQFHDSFECTWEGWRVNTNLQSILVLIDSETSCCETIGHISSHDDCHEFIGAELVDIQRVKEADLATTRVVEDVGDQLADRVIFVDFLTSLGKFQLTVYNDHNGYYGHSAVVISKQLKIEEVL